MTLVPNETERALNRQYDVYAAAREEYRKKIAEQAARIEQLEAALREIAKVTYGWEPGVWSDKEAYEYFASLFFGAQAKARAALKEKIDD